MPYLAPEDWAECVPEHEGSWWHAWNDWLKQRSTDDIDAGARTVNAGCSQVNDLAPGHYVLQR